MLTRFNHTWFHALVWLMLVFAVAPSVGRAATPECETSLRALVQAQNFPLAFHCAEQQFADDPDNMDALLVMARAAQELGRVELAGNLAAQARANPLTKSQRFAAYLISGVAQARQSNLIRAKILLYRASDFAQAEPELRVIRRTLNQIRSMSPWRFSAGLSVLPSTNINGGSLHDTITLGGLEFVLDDDAKAQSGIAYSPFASVTHQRRVSARTIWENRVSVAGTFYDGRGRNEGNYSLTSGLRHTPETERPMLVYGYIRYDKRFVADDIGGAVLGDYGVYYNQTTAGLEVHRNPDQTSAWKVYAAFSDRSSDIWTDQNAQIATVGATYRMAMTPRLELAFGGYVQRTTGDGDLAAKAANVSLGGTWNPEAVPFSFSGNLAYTHTEYTSIGFGYSEARVDDDVKLELSLTHDRLQFFGFKPTFGVAFSRDYSNLKRYDTQNAQVFTRLSVAF